MKPHIKRALDEGLYLIPLYPNKKVPALKDWPKKASNNPKVVASWCNRYTNFGIYTGKFKDNKALVAIDIDVKGGKPGIDEFKRLQKEWKLPKTRVQETPSGGRHVIYSVEEPFSNSVCKLADGLDIRSEGGQVVYEGSSYEGKYYKSNQAPIVELPKPIVEELKKLLNKPLPKVQTETKPVQLTESEIAALVEYAETTKPSIEGEGGHARLGQVVHYLRDRGAPLNLAYSLISGHFNPRCMPPWDEENLYLQVLSWYQSSKLNPGNLHPENIFTEIKDDSGGKNNMIEEYNKKYGLYFGGLHARILVDGADGYKFWTKQAFLEYHLNRKSAKKWLTSKDRKQYKSVVFKPGGDAGPEEYNIWKGFKTGEKEYLENKDLAKEGFERWKAHVFEGVCNSDTSLTEWFLTFFAHMIQKPAEKPLVSIVLQGGKGVGKNVVLDCVGSLLPNRHYLVTQNSRYLTSNFNAPLEGKLLTVLDEVFWAGDKKHEGILKGLITSKTLLIEQKGLEPYEIDHYSRIVLIGNEDWLVPASHDERRYAVFQVDQRKHPPKHYGDMLHYIKNKGGKFLLYNFLKDYDLGTADISLAPVSAGLIEQKLESLNTVEAFWRECISEGKILGDAFEALSFGSSVPVSALYHCMSNWIDKTRKHYYRKPYVNKFSQTLLKLCPSIERHRTADARCFTLPSVEQAKADFAAYLGVEADDLNL